jgi:hypothetical protein
MGAIPQWHMRGVPRARRCRAAVRSGLDEPATDGVAGQLHPIAHVELLEDVLAVALDGALADDEQVGDLPGRVPLGDELDDLRLALGQRITGEPLALAGALEMSRTSARTAPA